MAKAKTPQCRRRTVQGVQRCKYVSAPDRGSSQHGEQFRTAGSKATCGAKSKEKLECEVHQLEISVRTMYTKSTSSNHQKLDDLRAVLQHAAKIISSVGLKIKERSNFAFYRKGRCVRSMRGGGKNTPKIKSATFRDSAKRGMRNMNAREQFDCMCTKVLYHLKHTVNSWQTFHNVVQGALIDLDTLLNSDE